MFAVWQSLNQNGKTQTQAQYNAMRNKHMLTCVRALRILGNSTAKCCGTILVLGLAASPLLAKENNKTPGDSEIKAAVEGYLLFDSSIPSNNIDIVMINGIVTLSGTAPNLLAKDRATMISEAIRGVRAVVNNITVNPVVRSNDEIRTDIESALLSDSATDSYEVKTMVTEGEVTLTGKVDSWQEKKLSGFVARGVKGVKDVKNDLKVEYTTERPDSEIAAEVKKTLKRDVWVDEILISAEVHDGIVVLTGTVGSVAEKNRANSDAWTSGVKKVDDGDLKVEPWAKAGSMKRKNAFATRSDDEIKQTVKDAMMFDPRVNSFNPDVSVNSGVVTLSGIVDNLKAKMAAVQDAKNTVGVWRVKNHLKVRMENPPDDSKIAQNVKAALVRDPFVDRYEIGVTVYDGTVNLTGTVDSSFEKTRALGVVSGVKGVTSVNNGLAVSYPNYTYYSWPYSWYYNAPYYYNREPGWWPTSLVNDAEIKDDIEGEFFWSPFVDGDKITISVNDGVATLAGTVEDWNDVRDATENAYEGGAHKVINNLKVK
jgi:osmotically-inducible protein OsmY